MEVCFLIILLGIWNVYNARLFRGSLLPFKLLSDMVIFLASLWAFAMGAFRPIFIWMEGCTFFSSLL